jgi:hypothetical protein
MPVSKVASDFIRFHPVVAWMRSAKSPGTITLFGSFLVSWH